MQIQSIEIEGFWSYRDPQRIDIGDMPLVVGVGDNGAGKSALLVSAVLAAFYGKFPTKTIEESITTGAAQGHVSVEFVVNDTRYRVGRVYPRVGTPTGVVMVEDATQKTGWRTVTEKGSREVTDYITDLLGMDYETATMTWVAEQGQYGKFSSAMPSHRFKLLSSIFGLDKYAPLAKDAAAKLKVAATKVTGLDGRIAELQENLEDGDAEAAFTFGLAALTDEELVAKVAAVNADIDRVTQALADLNSTDPARQTTEARQALEIVRNERLGKLNAAREALSRAQAGP